MSNTLVLVTKDEALYEYVRDKCPYVILVKENRDYIDGKFLEYVSNLVLTQYFFVAIDDVIPIMPFDIKFKPPKHDSKYVHIWNDDPYLRLYNRLEVVKNPHAYDDKYVLDWREKLLKNHNTHDPWTFEERAPIYTPRTFHLDSKTPEFYYILEDGYDMELRAPLPVRHSHKAYLRQFKSYCMDFPVVDDLESYTGDPSEIVGFGGLTLHRKGNRNVHTSHVCPTSTYNPPVSEVEPFDIFYLCYDEPFKEENYERLVKRFGSRLKKVEGVKGIPEAHIRCAEHSDTTYFYVIDADCRLKDSFDFDDFYPADKQSVYVWKARNPLTGGVYGYGGVKLMSRDIKDWYDPRKTYTDFATTIANGRFKSMPNISNETMVDYSPFYAWRAAFRETAKLISADIREHDTKTKKRIDEWLGIKPKTEIHEYGLKGAQAGRDYALKTDGEIPKINDFDWIKSQFSLLTGE